MKNKQIFFLRHCPNRPPFHDYEQLDLKSVAEIATQKRDLSIGACTERLEQIEGLPAHAEIILHSPLERSRQTARLVNERFFKAQLDLEETGLLTEVYFNPAQLVGEEEHDRQGLALLRARVFEAMVASSGSGETAQELLDRVGVLDEMLYRRQETCIICVTHGFFMRYLDLFYRSGIRDSRAISVELLMRQETYDYATGFNVKF